jgi:hypothetical protein
MYELNQPFLTFTVREPNHTEGTVAECLRAASAFVFMMCDPANGPDPIPTAATIADWFEHTTISIGFEPNTAPNPADYFSGGLPIPTNAYPVAEWSSGDSIGYTSFCFALPNEPASDRYIWTDS